jgi:hypothetical protein
MAMPTARAAMLTANVSFEEIGSSDDAIAGSPVGDLFKITNTSEMGDLTAVVIALKDGLLFDTDYLTDVAGTSPSFPFVSSTIDPLLVSGSIVPDNASAIALTFQNFGPGKSYSFAIDVDRTGQASDDLNREVPGGDFEGIFSILFVGTFPGGVAMGSGEFDGDGDTAGGSVEIVLVPEPGAFGLGCAALAMVLALAVPGRVATRPRACGR